MNGIKLQKFAFWQFDSSFSHPTNQLLRYLFIDLAIENVYNKNFEFDYE